MGGGAALLLIILKRNLLGIESKTKNIKYRYLLDIKMVFYHLFFSLVNSYNLEIDEKNKQKTVGLKIIK